MKRERLPQEFYDQIAEHQEKHLNALKEKYPIEKLEDEFAKIEKLGYTVSTSNDQCQVWRGNDLIIDADFRDDFYENAVEMIEAFWHE